MFTEISAGLVVQDGKILLTQDDETGVWGPPTGFTQDGELSEDVVRRVVSEMAGCECSILRYRQRLKNEFEVDGEKFTFQPFSAEIDSEPDNGEWVPLSQLESRELARPLHEIREEMTERL
ncbi:MAG: NUDIX domain-containing protein [Candidatus Nanohaloarchaea archaeon]